MQDLLFGFISILINLSFVFALAYFYCKRPSFRKQQLSTPLYYGGLSVKILASIAFCYYHLAIYKGGDALHYFQDANLISNYFWIDINEFFYLWIGRYTSLNESYDVIQGLMYHDFYAVNTVRFSVPFALLSLGNIYACSIWLAFIAYSGVWKIYELLSYYFKEEQKTFSILLFLPSVIFWTAGLLKDTIILAAVCWMIYSVFRLTQYYRFRLKYAVIVLTSFAVIILIKPYVLMALLPPLFIWVFVERLQRAKNRLTKVILAPFFTVIVVGVIFLLFNLLEGNIGVYGKYDQLAEYTNSLKQAYSKTDNSGIMKVSNSNTTEFISVKSSLASFPTVLFRPFIWESWNGISLLSSLENFFLLMLNALCLLALLFHIKVFKLLVEKPFLLFCLLYSLVFIIGIGSSISNFGAIIRFRTAFILFFIIPCIIFISKVWKEFRRDKIVDQ